MVRKSHLLPPVLNHKPINMKLLQQDIHYFRKKALSGVPYSEHVVYARTMHHLLDLQKYRHKKRLAQSPPQLPPHNAPTAAHRQQPTTRQPE